jgi:hypothetical protein
MCRLPIVMVPCTTPMSTVRGSKPKLVSIVPRAKVATPKVKASAISAGRA